VIIISRLQ